MRIERRSLDQNCINYKSQAIVLPEPRVEINSLSAISGHTDIPESRAARADFSSQDPPRITVDDPRM